jgi:hypothetical protein
MIGRLVQPLASQDRRTARATPRPAAQKLEAGAFMAARHFVSVADVALRVPDPDHLVHLQLRRFAGCPVCNLHLRSIVRRHTEITAAGIREVVVFHSSADDLRPHVADLPFDVLADPSKQLYVAFGVESSPRALLDPRVWLPTVRGVAHSLLDLLRGRQPAPSLAPRGGRLGLPADFLIAPDGRLLASKYGAHAYDQWSVDELLALARSA